MNRHPTKFLKINKVLHLTGVRLVCNIQHSHHGKKLIGVGYIFALPFTKLNKPIDNYNPTWLWRDQNG